MVRRIDASASLHYHDSHFHLNVTSNAEHSAAGEGYPPFEFGTYETEGDEYQRLFRAAGELIQSEVPFTLSFRVHASRFGRETAVDYYATVRLSNYGETKQSTLELADERRETEVYLDLPNGKEALVRALDLTFGGFLSYCHEFNPNAHRLSAEHTALMEQYDSISDIHAALSTIFPKEIAEPIYYNASIQMQEEDIRSIRILTSTPWSEICQTYGLSAEDQFPLFFDIPIKDGCCMRLELQATSPDRPLQCNLSLFDPGDQCVGTLMFSGQGFPFGTHKLEHDGSIYVLDLDAAVGREYKAHTYDLDIIPGYSPEWHTQVVENAAKAYAKHGAEMRWEAEDALIWAMEEMVRGPDDLPFDLYSNLILEVDERCRDIEKTLDFRLSKIKADMEQNAIELPGTEKGQGR